MGHTGVIVDVVLCLVVILLIISCSVEGTDVDSGNGIPATEKFQGMFDDVNIPQKSNDTMLSLEEKNNKKSQVKKRKRWVGIGGTQHTHREIKNKNEDKYVEVASSKLLPRRHEDVGIDIVSLMVRNMPDEVFISLAYSSGSVGLFTARESTTIFPEYAHLADTPRCKGSCAGNCSYTCSGDGRKYDSVAGLGGRRATCLDDNYMCTDSDPYLHRDNILVHELAHTIHQYGLSYDNNNKVWDAYLNARDNINTWTPGCYAMSNWYEYFAEAAGIFFNVNHHSNSSGKMNRCGKGSGFCRTEKQARKFLKKKDPMIYEILLHTFTNNRENLKSGLKICQSK